MKNDLPVSAQAAEQVKLISQRVESMLDPIGIVGPLMHAQLAWWMHPQELGENLLRLSTELASLQLHTFARLAGRDVPDVVVPQRLDHRDTELLTEFKQRRRNESAQVKSTAASGGGGLFSRIRETFTGR